MSFDFTAKKIIVAGGSRGIGFAIAKGFAAAGADVAICARSPGPLAEARAELAGFGHKVLADPCDLGDGPAVLAWVEASAKSLGGVDVLINNASGFGATDTEEGWAAGLSVDVMATVRASRVAIPYLKASQGSIVNVSSISGFRSSTRTPAYAAVKALLINYTLSQAAMLAKDGIRVNAVAPGSIEFPGGSWEKRRLAGEPVYTNILNSIPFGRLGTPEEVADVALFLASPLARWVTGQTIIVDGGQMLG